MNTNKTSATSPQRSEKVVEEQSTLFTRENYKWMLIGLVIMAIGFFLMAGGKSEDPNVFNDNEIYGFRRITLAPILIVAGLVVEIFAIIKKPK
jgi:FtsH-binding integral membrane protein